VIPQVRKLNKFVVVLCRCDITLVDYSAHLCRPDIFVCITVVPLVLGQLAIAVIYTVHIQLEHNITWSLCF